MGRKKCRRIGDAFRRVHVAVAIEHADDRPDPFRRAQPITDCQSTKLRFREPPDNDFPQPRPEHTPLHDLDLRSYAQQLRRAAANTDARAISRICLEHVHDREELRGDQRFTVRAVTDTRSGANFLDGFRTQRAADLIICAIAQHDGSISVAGCGESMRKARSHPEHRNEHSHRAGHARDNHRRAAEAIPKATQADGGHRPDLLAGIHDHGPTLLRVLRPLGQSSLVEEGRPHSQERPLRRSGVPSKPRTR